MLNVTNAKTGEAEAPLIINKSLSVGDTFRLIGRAVTFRAVAVHDHPVVGAFVRGVSICGHYRTGARVCDTAKAA